MTRRDRPHIKGLVRYPLSLSPRQLSIRICSTRLDGSDCQLVETLIFEEFNKKESSENRVRI